MQSKWPMEKIGQHADVFSGFAFKSVDLNDQAGIPVVKIKNVNNKVVDLSDTQYFPEVLLAKKHDKFLLRHGDVLIAMTGQGSVGRIGRLSLKDERYVLLNQRVGKFVPKNSLNLRFLYYVASTNYYEEIFFNAGIGSGQPNLSPADIKNIEIPVPPLNEQKSIAHILGSLDDKIELNRQMNATLEAMAQALFKSWFVDFDPVIDNALAAGNPIPDELQARAEVRTALGDKRKPLPEAIQKQFPSGFVFSEEMGWIPEGWEVSEIGDHSLEIESGRRPKGGIDKGLDKGIPSVGAESICPIGEFDFSKAKMVTEEFAATAKKGWVRDYDVALYKDGGKPGLFKPRVSLYGESFPYEKFMVNEHVFLLRSQNLGQFFLYYTVTSQSFIDQLVAKGSAKAAQPGLNQGEVCDTRFLMPGSGVVENFNRLVAGDVSKRLALGKASLTLEHLRDTLLPKLLSGQLRIPDAEKLVTDVV